MARINLDTEVRFKAMLKQIGFKKKWVQFVKPHGETNYTLSFPYATNGQHFVRYYNCICGLNYPPIMEVAERIGVFVHGVSSQMRYIMPEGQKDEWRLADNDSDEYYLGMITEIIDTIKTFAFPFYEQWSTIRDYVRNMEDGIYKYGACPRSIPIAYYLLGEKGKALRYMDDYLEKCANDKDSVEIITTEGGGQITISHNVNGELESYQDFCQKFRPYMDSHPI